MSDRPVVVFDSVWKKFSRGERHDSLRDLLPDIARRLLGRRPPGDLADQEFWALRDVGFDVRPGEALGIIGPNGAGKSTALKLLTRILKPTRGHCAVRGRVGALIEVAAGFHPDLTGRENIFLQGAIMGMTRTEIAERFDEIVAFAGVSDFIDTPVKRYSSGMNARLGFSIAAHLRPDVLIIDEILAVGDMAFQERCVRRMTEFKRLGIGIVFVTHNLQAVAELCDRALFLCGGVVASGATDDVLQQYVQSSERAAETAGGDVSVADAQLIDANGSQVDAVSPGTPLRLQVVLHSRVSTSGLTFGFLVHRSTDNLLVYDGHTSGSTIAVNRLTPGEPVTLEFAFRPHLARGHYKVSCSVFHNGTQHFLLPKTVVGAFAVDERTTYAGIADLQVETSGWVCEGALRAC